MNRTYGRHIPKPLPAHRMLSRVAPSLPPVVDLRLFAGPVKDQGSLGSCTGHAFSSAMEWIFRAYHSKKPVLSPLYLYAQELIADGNFPNDYGSTGVTGSRISIFKGCCEDSLYPDTTQAILQPTAAQDENASEYCMGAYHGLTGSQVALSVIGDPVPWPVEVGFTVYSSFESEQVSETGIYEPKPGEQVLGGHEVLCLGYDVAPEPTLRPKNCPPAALIQNSWSAQWGIGGFFWMALPVLDDPQTDLKIVHSGKPWK